MVTKLKQKLRPLKYFLIYRGSNRWCPVCRNGASRFLEVGVVPRADARCPFCGALERHRLFWLFMERKMSLLSKPPQKALHIAPEAILEKKLRPLIGEGYVTADLFNPNVDLKMDITDIQFPENTFDFIYCSHV